MIVDLLRNDLGRISLPGSVEVTNLFSVERYPTLWQMTSTVQSQLKPNTSLVDVMSALFPCGSITGAPKISTMGIIRDLERFPRQIYTGTIGLIAPGGDCTFNVAIRTVLLNSKTGEATFGVGGGITYGSTADSEYDECLLKSSFLTTPPAHFELFESILLESGEYFLLDKHLARLEASAVYFDFSFNQPLVLERLNELREAFATGSWKVRLLLMRTGEVTVETLRIENEPISLTRVGLADESADSNDFSRYHKLTTNVAHYQRPLATHPDWDDVILWNERGEITESSVANIVVRRGEQLITPRLECGLLPGTFREALLERGEISEAVVTIDELRSVDEFFLINSVRKWRKAKLIQ
jgi:para-aminobenzoate synthetase/4-amino-4-deoxychorismate lyase